MEVQKIHPAEEYLRNEKNPTSLSINDLENYLSFIQCPHVFMSTRLHIYTYTSGLIYMFTYNHVFTSI